MKTYMPKEEEIEKKWYLVDLDGVTLGRAAVRVADILRGKNKPIFAPHVDAGDYVIAINASKVTISGNKATDKKYYRYSGYPGGLKEITFEKLLAKNPAIVFEHAVKGMLPKNRLGRKMFKKLHVYPDAEHKHKAQKPEAINLFE
jgi:large subunit ribosomal protein L13